MAPPIQVAYRHFTPTDAMKAKIQDLLKQFDAFEDAIVFGEVVVDATGKKGDKTELEIRVQLDLPGGAAVAKRSADVP
jgi:ribosome-associated translation inhibitor RaiA